MNKAVRSLALATALIIFGAAAANAAVVRAGDTMTAIAVHVNRGNSVAYDSINHVYLVVSAHGVLRGRFIDLNGQPIGAPFVIQSSVNFTQYPAVRFSPDADGGNGGFLVAWHENDIPSAAFIHARIVSLRAGGPVSAESVLVTEGAFWEQAPGIAYSPASQEFLLTFTRFDWGIRAIRVDNNAVAKDAVFTVTRTAKYEGHSNVAYSPVSNNFVVVFKGYDDAIRSGFVDARLVQAGTNTLIGETATRVGQGGGTYITDVAYQSVTNQFMVAWYRDAGGGAQTSMGRLINADLSPAGAITPLSSLWKSYDALGLAYNPITNSFFMISHDGRGLLTSIEDGGVELTAAGNPVDNGFLVTLGAGKPNYYPKIAASTGEPTWLASTAYGFVETKTQLLAGGPTAPPPPPQPLLNIDLPGSHVVQKTFLMAGWGLDRGAGSGNGADVIHVWAWPVNGGAPLFAGVASVNLPRPDLASAFGPQFANSGWALTISNLPPGPYVLAAYLHSTVTDSFASAKTLAVNIVDPIMSIDTPGDGAERPTSGFWLGGWSIDRGAAAGTPGVDALHVWAYNVAGGAPQWVGTADYGVTRLDIAATYGSQFLYSGYRIFINNLGPGTYDIVVFSHSTVTGTFTNARIVRVTVK